MLQSLISQISLDDIYFGNKIFDYAIMVIIFLSSLIILNLVQRFLWNRFRYFAEKTHSRIYESLAKISSSISPYFLSFLAVYIAAQELLLHSILDKILTATLALWVSYQLIIALEIIVDHQITSREGEQEEDHTAKRMVHFVIKMILGATGLLWALSSFGVNVTSLITGLGVGGIVIAFAAQNILIDLFSSFSIFISKPFIVGDTITVGANSGTVEKIGMKTTRIRSQQGEELVISNKELTAARIQNFRNMNERRVSFIIKVSHATNSKKLREIPPLIKEIIAKESRARLDRIHFKSISDNSFDFEIVYFIIPPDYSVFMDIHQDINLAILEKFEKEKIKIAANTKISAT